jgi:hypothetical protein
LKVPESVAAKILEHRSIDNVASAWEKFLIKYKPI